MAERAIVLDASALLAVLFDEPGAERVAASLSGALVSAVDFHEVIAKLVDRDVPDDVFALLDQLDITVVPVDRAQAEIGGRLRAQTREAKLSLGDRCCLALASVRGATALTADRDWATLNLEIAVELVR